MESNTTNDPLDLTNKVSRGVDSVGIAETNSDTTAADRINQSLKSSSAFKLGCNLY